MHLIEEKMWFSDYKLLWQLGTAIGVTVTTVVYNSVGKNIASIEDNIATYHAAQWTAFAFGVIGIWDLSLLSFTHL